MTPFEKAKLNETTCKNCEKSESVNGVLYCTANGKIIMPRFEDMCLCSGKLKEERESIIAYMKDLPTCWADDGDLYSKPMKYPDGMFDCEDFIDNLKDVPTADFIPVIRCKDCAYYETGKDYTPYCNHIKGLDCVSSDDFCNYGKRKDDESDKIY